MKRPALRPLRPGDAPACEGVLRALPDWFGIEESIVQYVAELPGLQGFVAEEAGRVVGFVSLRRPFPPSAEIHVIGVLPDRHGRGIGRALVERAETSLRADGVEYLQVKTLGPSRPNAHYERTRGFYERLGFRALEENALWGEHNPCLIMVKHLGPAR